MSVRRRRVNTAISVSASVNAGRNALRRFSRRPSPDVSRTNPIRGNDGHADHSPTATAATTTAATAATGRRDRTDRTASHAATSSPTTSVRCRGTALWNTKKKISSSAARNGGTEMIPAARPSVARSNDVPSRYADHTPSGTAITSAMTSAIAASWSVIGSDCWIRSRTSRPGLTIERPKSPPRASPSQSPYRSTTPLSRPSSTRARS